MNLEGKKLGPYNIKKYTGKNEGAYVFQAEDSKSGNSVILKVLRVQWKSGKEKKRISELFLNSAKWMNKISHPNLLKTLNAGVLKDGFFLVNEMFDGRLLSEELAPKERLPWQEIKNIALQICGTLTQMHENGIAHGDLRPDIILLNDSGTVKVIDPCLSQLNTVSLSVSSAQNRTWQLAAYQAPETLPDKMPEAPADIYSLGVVMFECLTGRKPFQGRNLEELIDAIQSHEAPSLADLVPNIPPALNEIVQKCLQKSLDERYSKVWKLREALESVEDNDNKEEIDKEAILDEAIQAFFDSPDDKIEEEKPVEEVSEPETDDAMLSPFDEKVKKDDNNDIKSVAEEIELEQKSKLSLDIDVGSSQLLENLVDLKILVDQEAVIEQKQKFCKAIVEEDSQTKDEVITYLETAFDASNQYRRSTGVAMISELIIGAMEVNHPEPIDDLLTLLSKSFHLERSLRATSIYMKVFEDLHQLFEESGKSDHDKRLVQIMVHDLKNNPFRDIAARKKILQTLGMYNDRETINEIAGFVKESRLANEVLDVLKDKTPEVNDMLLEIVKNAESKAIRFRAIDLIKASGSLPFKEILQSLTDSRWYVRRNMLTMLGMVKNPQSIKSIINLLGDSTPQVRMEALQALFEVSPYEALSFSSIAAKDEDMEVRLNAIRILGKLGTPKTIELLSKLLTTSFKEQNNPNDKTRIEICKALGMTGSADAVSALTSVVEEKRPYIRDKDMLKINAVRALGKIGHPKSTQALERLRSNKDKSIAVAAKMALEFLKSK